MSNQFQPPPPPPYGQPWQHQRVGSTQSRVRMSRGWHAMHITLTVLTGGLWGLVYLAQYLKHTSKRREITYS
jgi:hypothetical protein